MNKIKKWFKEHELEIAVTAGAMLISGASYIGGYYIGKDSVKAKDILATVKLQELYRFLGITQANQAFWIDECEMDTLDVLQSLTDNKINFEVNPDIVHNTFTKLVYVDKPEAV